MGSPPSFGAQAAAWLARVVCVLIALGSLGASCAQKGLALMPGVVNDPANLSLRRAVFGFASSTICPEFQKKTVPLALHDGDPSTGRFFPTACAVQELASGSLFLQFSGRGYAWTNVTGKLGFEASAAVEYRHDFQMDGTTMYVYFRQKQTQSTAFRVLSVERAAGGTGQGFADLLAASVAAASEQIGQRILQQKVAQGFTVIRDPDGGVSFSLGVLDVGVAPAAPFGRGDSDWLVLANERTEIHQGQRDFTGPFYLENADQALYLTADLQGAAAIDVLAVPKAAGDAWIEAYARQPAAPPLDGTPLTDDVLEARPAGVSSAPWKRTLRLPIGEYYLVFDHTTNAGRTSPPAQTLDDRAALVSYAVQLGDAP
jgi:hypothetical protein